MKKIKWILPLGLTAVASSIAPAITSCSCFKSFKVSVTGKYSNLDGQQFKAKYHKTFDKTGTWEPTKTLSWEVYIGETKYIKGDSKDINIYNNGSSLYIHIGWRKVENTITIKLFGSGN